MLSGRDAMTWWPDAMAFVMRIFGNVALSRSHRAVTPSPAYRGNKRNWRALCCKQRWRNVVMAYVMAASWRNANAVFGSQYLGANVTGCM